MRKLENLTILESGIELNTNGEIIKKWNWNGKEYYVQHVKIIQIKIDLSTCLSTKTIIDDRPDKMFYIKSIQDLFKIFRTVFKSHLFIMII